LEFVRAGPETSAPFTILWNRLAGIGAEPGSSIQHLRSRLRASSHSPTFIFYLLSRKQRRSRLTDRGRGDQPGDISATEGGQSDLGARSYHANGCQACPRV